jgi:hypothetical protein
MRLNIDIISADVHDDSFGNPQSRPQATAVFFI